MTREIDVAEAADPRRRPKPPPAARGGGGAPSRPAARGDREIRKEVAAVERTIAKLDADRKRQAAALLEATDPAEALRLHEAVSALAADLAAAEERWLALQEELAGADANQG